MSGDTAGLIISWGLIIYFIFKFFSERSSSDIPLFDADSTKSNTKYFKDITDTTDIWMLNLWRWADENDIENETIPREKDKLMEVTVLQLFNSQLKTLPKEIGNLINLRELRLKRNELTTLPKEIGNLRNLEFLSP